MGTLDRGDQREVEGVAGVARDDVTEDRPAQQREVADQVEDLVADELVAVAELVQDAALADDDRVVERAALGEAVLPEVPHVLQEPVGAGGGELLDEHVLRRLARDRLRADHGMGAVERVADAKHVAGDDLEPAGIGADPDRLVDDERLPTGRQGHAAGRVEQRDEGSRAAVDRRDLGPVDPDLEVVEPQAGRRGHQVLDRLDPCPVDAEGGRVVGVHHARGERGDGRLVTGDAEDDAAVGAGGGEGDPRGSPRM